MLWWHVIFKQLFMNTIIAKSKEPCTAVVPQRVRMEFWLVLRVNLICLPINFSTETLRSRLEPSWPGRICGKLIPQLLFCFLKLTSQYLQDLSWRWFWIFTNLFLTLKLTHGVLRVSSLQGSRRPLAARFPEDVWGAGSSSGLSSLPAASPDRNWQLQPAHRWATLGGGRRVGWGQGTHETAAAQPPSALFTASAVKLGILPTQKHKCAGCICPSFSPPEKAPSTSLSSFSRRRAHSSASPPAGTLHLSEPRSSHSHCLVWRRGRSVSPLTEQFPSRHEARSQRVLL